MHVGYNCIGNGIVPEERLPSERGLMDWLNIFDKKFSIIPVNLVLASNPKNRFLIRHLSETTSCSTTATNQCISQSKVRIH